LNTIQVLQRLDKEPSVSVYLVGGFVRDFLLGSKSFDLDVVVRGTTIKRLKSFLSQYGKVKTIELSKVKDSFGVRIVLFEAHGDEMVAQIKLPARGKKQVQESHNTLRQDASHRDFTINAMYFPINAKEFSEIIDFHDGKKDINNKCIRAVGDAVERMEEHPVRMMRAISLAARTDFTIDEDVLFAIKHCSHLLKNVHADAIRKELNYILLSDKPSACFKLMHILGLLTTVLPELAECIDVKQERKHHKWDVFHHCIYTCDNVESDLVLRLSGLLHDIGKPATRKIVKGKGITFHKHEVVGARIARKILTKLGYSNYVKKEVSRWIRLHMYHYTREYGDTAIRRFITKAEIKKEDLDNLESFPLFKLRAAERLGNGFKKIPITPKQKDFEKRIIKIYGETTAFGVNDLALKGDDVMEVFKLKQSNLIGRIKKHLLEKVLSDQKLNNRIDLIKLAAIYINKQKEGNENKKN